MLFFVNLAKVCQQASYSFYFEVAEVQWIEGEIVGIAAVWAALWGVYKDYTPQRELLLLPTGGGQPIPY